MNTYKNCNLEALGGNTIHFTAHLENPVPRKTLVYIGGVILLCETEKQRNLTMLNMATM